MACASLSPPEVGLADTLISAWKELDSAQSTMLARKAAYRQVRNSLKPEQDRLRHRRRELQQQIEDARRRRIEATNPEDASKYHIRTITLKDERDELWPVLASVNRQIGTARSAWRLSVDAYRECKSRLNAAKRALAEEVYDTIAEHLPVGYRDHFKIVVQIDKLHIYFGGGGRPDGEGHAHYITNHGGELIWRREVGERRGRRV